MNETTILANPVLPTIRKCKIEEVFDGSFIELVALVPQNPYVRALILKLTGKMPGLECETFEGLKEWVETHCEKRVRPPVHREQATGDGISINVEFSETEYGTARYSVPRSGTDSFHLDADELVEIVQAAIDAGTGMDRVVEVIAEQVDEDAWNQCDPDLNDYGEYDYDNYDVTDAGEGSVDYAKDQIRTAVLVFVRARHPELAAEL